MSTTATKTALIVGVGPGLGMSMAHQLGRQGYRLALVSRTRHPQYIDELAAKGIQADGFTADVRDRDQLLAAVAEATALTGQLDLVYYGPGGADPDSWPVPITEVDSDSVRRAFGWVYPAVDVVSTVLPAMLERGSGAIMFAGGLSGAQPMPALGNLALMSAALRNYALTLHAGLGDRGIYAGTLTIGGVIDRGDIHAMIAAAPDTYGDVGPATLDPDKIAEVAWAMISERDRAEEIFSVFG